MILAAVDGSSLANPGPSGWAWYIDDSHWSAGGWAKGTNNMGELMAVIALLRATKEVAEPLRVLCDSQYVINCCTRWIPAWKKRGWRKADNKPVLNLDLVKQLDEELQGRKVTFQWVRGHTGHPLNERADEIARAAATAYQQGTPVAIGPGYSKTPLIPRTLDDVDADGIEVEPFPEDFDDDALFTLPDPMEEPSPPKPRELADPSLIVDITELTRELMSDEVQLDRERLDTLMHRDFVAHLPGGLIRTKGSILARSATLTGSIQMDVYGADLLDRDVVLLRYRMKRNSEDHLCAIVWQRVGREWQARFHQMTPIA